MKSSTLGEIPGQSVVEDLGIVEGSSVRAKHVGHDIFANLKNLVGGELHSYAALLAESRAAALKRMEEQAQELGADAIIGVRFATSSIAAGAAEVLAYGTAVKLGSSARE